MLFPLLVLSGFCCVDGHLIISHSETQQNVYIKDSNNYAKKPVNLKPLSNQGDKGSNVMRKVGEYIAWGSSFHCHFSTIVHCSLCFIFDGIHCT